MKIIVTAALTSMYVWKTQFQGSNWKQFPQKSKLPIQKYSWVIWSKTNWSFMFLEWISWQISSNELFQRNIGPDLERDQTSELCSKQSPLQNVFKKRYPSMFFSVSVLLSPLIKRFYVSRMRDSLYYKNIKKK